MSSAGLVYINNFKFGPELNGKILSNNTPCHTAYTDTFIDLFIHQELLLTVFGTGELCPYMPKGCKLVLSPHPIYLLNRVFTSLSQICFDSLVPTRSHMRKNDTDVVLSYKKLIKVRFY
jgi:hypothetical protein